MNKIILITPTYRSKNLRLIKKSINFDFIKKWIIVHDKEKITDNHALFHNDDKIIEIFYKSKKDETSGNAQRNIALDYICQNFIDENFYLYYLDDDNIIHPSFYEIAKDLKNNHLYTFDQQRTRYILDGTTPKAFHIDLAQFLTDFNLVRNIRWKNLHYHADGSYIEECYNLNKSKHIYIKKIGCYYNYLTRNIFRRIFYIILWYVQKMLIQMNIIKSLKRNKP